MEQEDKNFSVTLIDQASTEQGTEEFLRLWSDLKKEKFDEWEKQYVLGQLKEIKFNFTESVNYYKNEFKKK